jgi:hypothetical protein
MKLVNKLVIGAAAFGAFSAGSANAAVALVASGDYFAFPTVEYLGGAAQSFAGGQITWSTTNASNQGGSAFGYTQGYNFADNGNSSGVPLAGLNSSSDTYQTIDSMTFSFANPVSSAGAVWNWVKNAAPVSLYAYDSSNALIGSYTFSANGLNFGSPDVFVGFTFSSPMIAKLVATDGYIAAIGGLSVSGLAPVPEPAAWGLMIGGFALTGVALRRARRGKMSAKFA